jgi:hypothetical protein
MDLKDELTHARTAKDAAIAKYDAAAAKYEAAALAQNPLASILKEMLEKAEQAKKDAENAYMLILDKISSASTSQQIAPLASGMPRGYL